MLTSISHLPTLLVYSAPGGSTVLLSTVNTNQEGAWQSVYIYVYKYLLLEKGRCETFRGGSLLDPPPASKFVGQRQQLEVSMLVNLQLYSVGKYISSFK